MATSKTIVLITGSNQGIGFDTAAAIAAAGDYHVIITSRSVEKGKKAIADLEAKHLPGTFSLVQLDVTDESTITAAASEITTQFGRIDVLINNAGIVSSDPNPKINAQSSFESNATGAALVTAAIEPLLKKSSNPRLIFISSGLGSITARGDPTDAYHGLPALEYRMSKAALNMLAVHSHVTYQSWGCKVWALCPGFVVTNLTGEADKENRVKQGALSSETSAATILSVVEGKRDADVGRFVHKDGVYPW